jgi:hypothetical protein
MRMSGIEFFLGTLHCVLRDAGSSAAADEMAREFNLRVQLAVEPEIKEQIRRVGNVEIKHQHLLASTAYAGERLDCDLSHLRKIAGIAREQFLATLRTNQVIGSQQIFWYASEAIAQFMRTEFIVCRSKVRGKLIDRGFDFMRNSQNFGDDWLETAIQHEAVRAVELGMIEHRRMDAVGETKASRAKLVLNQPRKEAFKAYRAHKVLGMKQPDIAKELDTNQGQVSRWCSQVGTWLEAGNVMPDMDGGSDLEIITMDPAKLELGERQRSGVQSRRAGQKQQSNIDE